MKIPWSTRKKALLLVDIQPGFLNKRNWYIIDRVKLLIENTDYDFFIESIFHTEKGSIWDRQMKWTLPKDENFKTVDQLAELLATKECLHLEKETKSAFKGSPDLHSELKKRNIEELHIVGMDTNDCVLASAFEAFDLNYFTYVIEECAESSKSVEMRKVGFSILRQVKLTNNTCIEPVDFKDISLR